MPRGCDCVRYIIIVIITRDKRRVFVPMMLRAAFLSHPYAGSCDLILINAGMTVFDIVCGGRSIVVMALSLAAR